jgi:hypothetical protein
MRPRNETEINRGSMSDFELVSGNRKVKELVLIRKKVKQKVIWGRKGGLLSLGRGSVYEHRLTLWRTGTRDP